MAYFTIVHILEITYLYDIVLNENEKNYNKLKPQIEK